MFWVLKVPHPSGLKCLYFQMLIPPGCIRNACSGHCSQCSMEHVFRTPPEQEVRIKYGGPHSECPSRCCNCLRLCDFDNQQTKRSDGIGQTTVPTAAIYQKNVHPQLFLFFFTIKSDAESMQTYCPWKVFDGLAFNDFH